MLRLTISRIRVPRLGRCDDFETQASTPAPSASPSQSSSIRIVRSTIVESGVSSRHSRMRSRQSSEFCISSTSTMSGWHSRTAPLIDPRPSTLPSTFRRAVFFNASRMVSTTKELSATITTLFIGIDLLVRWAGRAPSPYARRTGPTSGTRCFFLASARCFVVEGRILMATAALPGVLTVYFSAREWGLLSGGVRPRGGRAARSSSRSTWRWRDARSWRRPRAYGRRGRPRAPSQYGRLRRAPGRTRRRARCLSTRGRSAIWLRSSLRPRAVSERRIRWMVYGLAVG